MYLASKVISMYLESPLHAGAGSGLGAIDLPIQRERYTGYPIVQASSLKGALRSQCPEGAAGSQENKKFTAVFGPEDASFAGAFGVGDARILLFPVRSLVGIFAWATCADVLHRWQREVQNICGALPSDVQLPANEPAHNQCYAGSDIKFNNHVVLEEYAFQVDNTYDLGALAGYIATKYLPTINGNGRSDLYLSWKNRLKNSLVILRNDVFRDLVMHTTEVLTRVRLDRNTKTAVGKALWTEEHLPCDTLMYAPVRAMPLRTPDNGATPTDWNALTPQQQADNVLGWANSNTPNLIQIGGDETVGRGLVRLTWLP